MKWIPQKYHNLIRGIIGVAIFIWLISLVDMGEVLELFRKGDPVFLLAGVFFLLVGYCGFHGYRFHLSIRKISPNIATSFKLFFLGYLFNNLFPGTAGGDGVRLYYLHRMTNAGWGKPAGLLLVFRITGMIALWIAGTFYVIFNFSFIVEAFKQYITLDLTTGLTTILIIVAIVVALAILLFFKNIKDRIVRFLKETISTLTLFDFKSYSHILIHSFGFHFARMLGFYFLVMFFGAYVEYIHLLFPLVISGIAITIPISLGGLGVMEGAMAGSLILFDVSVAAASGITLVHRLVLLLIAFFGGVAYLMGIPEEYMNPMKESET